MRETEYSETGAGGKAIGAFEQTYRKSPEHTAFTPYRVCPIGAHSDHQLGKITGFAIDKGHSYCLWAENEWCD